MQEAEYLIHHVSLNLGCQSGTCRTPSRMIPASIGDTTDSRGEQVASSRTGLSMMFQTINSSQGSSIIRASAESRVRGVAED